jgi:hypothetical protein
MLETVDSFIVMVEANQHIEAVERFYADHAMIRDNQSAETRTKEKQVENEKNLHHAVNKMYSQCLRPYFIKDNFVVIKWRFRFEFKNDTFIEIEEIACQEWDNGLIIYEQFFFDPKQFVPKPLV